MLLGENFSEVKTTNPVNKGCAKIKTMKLQTFTACFLSRKAGRYSL
jgi:hypothetical protein